jgi:hypothetical protein
MPTNVKKIPVLGLTNHRVVHSKAITVIRLAPKDKIVNLTIFKIIFRAMISKIIVIHFQIIILFLTIKMEINSSNNNGNSHPKLFICQSLKACSNVL